MKGIWNDDEVKSLFTKVEECKKNNQAVRNAFLQHGKEFNRQPNSVRNYYYHEIDNLIEDKLRCERVGIDISKHKKTNIAYLKILNLYPQFPKIFIFGNYLHKNIPLLFIPMRLNKSGYFYLLR